VEELLARSRESLLWNQVHDAVIVTDLEGTIHLWNSGAERVYGYTSQEIVGKPIGWLYFPEDFGVMKREVLAPLGTKDLHEVALRNRRKDDTEIFIDLRVSVVRNRSGKPIGYAGCSNDITVRKRAEEALESARQDLEERVVERSQKLLAEIAERTRIAAELQSSREKLRHILANAPGVLYSCSPDTFTATFVTEKVESVLGIRAAEFIHDGDPWMKRIHSDDRPRVMEATERIKQCGCFLLEYRVRHQDGSFRWVRDNASLIRDGQGKAVEIVGYMQDITDAKQAEEARREQDRLEFLARQLLTAQESERKKLAWELHDNLNQQLAALVLDMASLERTLPKSRNSVQARLKRLKQRVAGISDDVDRMARRLHPATLEQFGLRSTLKSECAALAKRTGIHLEFRCRSFPKALSKEVELCLYRVAQECLGNLSRHADASRACLRLEGDADHVRMVIEDSGIGFDASAVPRESLGLLNMAERVRLLRGTLTVDSVIGRGTSVDVSLPLEGGANDEGSRTTR
jgi:PAS domain S-box-containing protein